MHGPCIPSDPVLCVESAPVLSGGALLPVYAAGPRHRERLVSALVSEEDKRDIVASLQGIESAYAALVARYQHLVHAQMWRFSRNPAQVEELVQDVFVEVYLGLRNFRGESPFEHWLRKVAMRVGYRFWKQQHRLRARRELLMQLPATMPEDPAHLTPSEAGEVLYQLLSTLAPADRLALTLHYFEGYTAKEVAEVAGWSPTLVRVRMHRACKRLREQLQQAGYRRSGHA